MKDMEDAEEAVEAEEAEALMAEDGAEEAAVGATEASWQDTSQESWLSSALR